MLLLLLVPVSLVVCVLCWEVVDWHYAKAVKEAREEAPNNGTALGQRDYCWWK